MSPPSPGTRSRLIRLAALSVTVLAVVIAAVVLAYPSRGASTGAGPAVPGSSSLPGQTPAASPTPTARPTPTSVRAATIHVLGLGDSVTYGSNCDCDDYIVDFGALLHTQDNISAKTDNEGEPGATTADLAQEIAHDSKLRQQATQADIIVVTIGANDLSHSLDQWRDDGCSTACYQPGIDAMASRLQSLLQSLHHLQSSPAGQILVTNYWNVFADGQVAGRAESAGYPAWSDQITRAANAAICQSATSAASTCVDLYQAFKPQPDSDPTHLLADDGDHPNSAGTALISRTVLAALDRTTPH